MQNILSSFFEKNFHDLTESHFCLVVETEASMLKPKKHALGRRILGIRVHDEMTQEQIQKLISAGHGGLFIGSPEKEATNAPIPSPEPETKPKRKQQAPESDSPSTESE